MGFIGFRADQGFVVFLGVFCRASRLGFVGVSGVGFRFSVSVGGLTCWFLVLVGNEGMRYPIYINIYIYIVHIYIYICIYTYIHINIPMKG